PFRKQAKVAAPVALVSEPPLRQPTANRPCGCCRRRGVYSGEIRSDDAVAAIRLPQVGGIGFRQELRDIGRDAAGNRPGVADHHIGAGGLLVWKELDVLWLSQCSRMQVDVDATAR